MKLVSKLSGKNLSGKTCLLRVDYNFGDKKDTFRLYSSLPTIKFLLKKKAKIVLLSHHARPKRKDNQYSLKSVVPYLKENLKHKVSFFANFDFVKIKKLIEKSPAESIFLLENLRFLPAEEKNSPALAKQLAALGDVYINDAFGASHRKHSSIVRLPKYLPSFAGLLMEKEITALDKILKSAKKSLVIILGGAKVADKIGVIENFIKKAGYFLIGGIVADTFFKARGFDIEKSEFDENSVKAARKLLKHKKIILPVDFIFHKGKILDIGPMSVKLFQDKIRTAKTILWNGPLGFFEDKRFRNGSREIALAAAGSRAHKVVGGGETVRLIRELNLEKKMDFISTGGGAMLSYLAGKKLPGIAALEKNKKKLT